MYRLKERPAIRAMEYITSMPHTLLAAQRVPKDLLGVGAAVFCGDEQGVPRLLLLQRSESDSMPGNWELPGGGVDKEDITVKDAVARELKEEAGLTVSWIIQEVGHGTTFDIGRGGKPTIVLKVTFVVEVEEIEALKDKMRIKSAGQAGVKGDDQSINKPPPLDFRNIPVVLNDKEHQQFVWITEDQLRRHEIDGKRLRYTSDDQKAVMLEAFQVQKHVMNAQSTLDEDDMQPS